MTLAVDALISELSGRLADNDPSRVVMAFDGDGTLWSGDVGEDLFRAAMHDDFLVDAALPALLAEAAHHRVPVNGSDGANAVARTLLTAYLAGEYPEREICAMMTWCYAGRALADVEALAKTALKNANLANRLHEELAPIIEWGRRKGVRSVLISASPRPVVEAAAAFLSIAPADIAAATPAVEAGRVLPRLAEPVPYAEAKLTAGRRLFGDARWLAAFGDNVFDIDMLTTAEIGIAVRPKPKLIAELGRLDVRVLDRHP